MNSTPSSAEASAATVTAVAAVVKGPAVAALEQDPKWLSATEAQRTVLLRIATQRDRLNAAKQAQLQASTLRAPVSNVPADAPFAQRLAVFAKLHPLATASVAGLAMMLGPRKLLRYGSIAWPLLNKFKR